MPARRPRRSRRGWRCWCGSARGVQRLVTETRANSSSCRGRGASPSPRPFAGGRRPRSPNVAHTPRCDAPSSRYRSPRRVLAPAASRREPHSPSLHADRGSHEHVGDVQSRLPRASAPPPQSEQGIRHRGSPNMAKETSVDIWVHVPVSSAVGGEHRGEDVAAAAVAASTIAMSILASSSARRRSASARSGRLMLSTTSAVTGCTTIEVDGGVRVPQGVSQLPAQGGHVGVGRWLGGLIGRTPGGGAVRLLRKALSDPLVLLCSAASGLGRAAPGPGLNASARGQGCLRDDTRRGG